MTISIKHFITNDDYKHNSSMSLFAANYDWLISSNVVIHTIVCVYLSDPWSATIIWTSDTTSSKRRIILKSSISAAFFSIFP